MNNKTRKMVTIAMCAAMGTVLQFIAFPIIPAFSFLKIDFSDIPVMIVMFLFGPFAGVATAFLRSLLHLFLSGFHQQISWETRQVSWHPVSSLCQCTTFP